MKANDEEIKRLLRRMVELELRQIQLLERRHIRENRPDSGFPFNILERVINDLLLRLERYVKRLLRRRR